MKRLFIIICCTAVLFGCSEKKEYKYDNPFDISVTILRSVVGNKVSFVDDEVVIGPMIITSHQISSNIFVMSPINEEGTIDSEVSIDVYYGQLSNKNTWIESKTGDILFIRGAIHYYNYSTQIYLHAHDIKYLDHMNTK